MKVKFITQIIIIFFICIFMTSCNEELQKKIQDTSDNINISKNINENEYNDLNQEEDQELLNHIREYINNNIWFKGIYTQFYNMASQTYDVVFYKRDNHESGVIYAFFQQEVTGSSYFKSKTSGENWVMYCAIGSYKGSRGYVDTYDTFYYDTTMERLEKRMNDLGYKPYSKSKITFGEVQMPQYKDFQKFEKKKMLDEIEAILDKKIEDEIRQRGIYKVYVSNFNENSAEVYAIIEERDGENSWIMKVTLYENGMVEYGNKTEKVIYDSQRYFAEQCKKVAILVKEVQLTNETGQIVPKPEYQNKENFTNINEQENIIYINDDKFAFSLVFPKSWEGKYLIDKNEMGINIYYNTEVGRRKKILFFLIGRIKKSEWMGNTGAPISRIYEDDEFIYYVTVPEKIGFDLSLENERKEADEFRNLFKDIRIIIDSFELIRSTSP